MLDLIGDIHGHAGPLVKPLRTQATSLRATSFPAPLRSMTSAMSGARKKRAPHFLAEHVFTLAQAFSTFWVASPPILKEPDEAVRGSRLRLARTVLTQLELGLGLLGIEIPERM